MKPLARSFFKRDTALVAKELLGKILVCSLPEKPFMGRIVETEAYRSDDPACHAYKERQTKSNAALFGPVGHTYVYLSYGIHWCLNIVSRDETVPAGGVLIRAVEVIDPHHTLIERIDGPGRTGKALNVTLEHNSIDVTESSSQLCLYDAEPVPESLIHTTPRIGISQGTDTLWRFIRI